MEKIVTKTSGGEIVYKDKPVEKIVYKDKPVERLSTRTKSSRRKWKYRSSRRKSSKKSSIRESYVVIVVEVRSPKRLEVTIKVGNTVVSSTILIK